MRAMRRQLRTNNLDHLSATFLEALAETHHAQQSVVDIAALNGIPKPLPQPTRRE
jgi:hypothetical protein